VAHLAASSGLVWGVLEMGLFLGYRGDSDWLGETYKLADMRASLSLPFTTEISSEIVTNLGKVT